MPTEKEKFKKYKYNGRINFEIFTGAIFDRK